MVIRTTHKANTSSSLSSAASAASAPAALRSRALSEYRFYCPHWFPFSYQIAPLFLRLHPLFGLISLGFFLLPLFGLISLGFFLLFFSIGTPRLVVLLLFPRIPQPFSSAPTFFLFSVASKKILGEPPTHPPALRSFPKSFSRFSTRSSQSFFRFSTRFSHIYIYAKKIEYSILHHHTSQV